MGALGGPIEGDASESVYSTWAIAHGDFSCSFPPIGHHHINVLANPFAAAAPLYPLVAGAIEAILRIGHSVAFPPRSVLGANCASTVSQFFHWSVTSSSILTTIRVGYVVWPILLWGAVSLVRAGPRKGTWWEPVTGLALALVSPLWLCLVEFFHPQDVLAMALLLLAASAVLRGKWAFAGVAVGLAAASQQFALLVAIPLLVVAPRRCRRPYLVGAIAATALIDIPMAMATSGRAVRAILTGSSRAGSHVASYGGTVLWELHLRGTGLFLVSRCLPLVATALLALWVRRRFGGNVLEPTTVVALVGASLGIRLVFEENLYGYYFMAIGVMLVVADCLVGRLRGSTWAWLGLVALAFNPVNPGFYSNWTTWSPHLYRLFPMLVFLIGLAVSVAAAARRRLPAYAFAWIAVALFTSQSLLWGGDRTLIALPHWAWQLILVPAGLFLLGRPLAITPGTPEQTSPSESPSPSL